MDGCVAVAVAVAEAEAEAVAVAMAVCTMHIFPVCTMHKVSPWGHLGVTSGSLFRRFSDFFRVGPGVFPGGLGIVEGSSREVLGVFWDTFFRYFSDFSGLVRGGPPVFFRHSWMVFGHVGKKC